MADALQKFRGRIRDLIRAGSLSRALELQQWLVNNLGHRAWEWTRLAFLARKTNNLALELEARVQAAELARVGEDHWRMLAQAARDAGLPRWIAAAEAHLPCEQADVKTLTYIGSRAILGADEERDQHTGSWASPEPDLGSGADPTLARFVCSPQAWPTVLACRCLMFAGQRDDIDPAVYQQMEPVLLGASSPILTQGKLGQLVYSIEQGSVHATRDRGFFEEVATLQAGAFFGEAGVIAGVPSTTTIVTLTDCELRVLSRNKLHLPPDPAATGLPPVVSQLRAWYLEAATSLCPLFADLDQEEVQRCLKVARHVTYRTGERMLELDEAGGVQIIVVGVARVVATVDGVIHVVGRQGTGDLIGGLSPSPVTVVSDSTVFALQIDHEQLSDLSAAVRQRVEQHEEAGRQALALLAEGS